MSKVPDKMIEVELEIKIIRLGPPGSAVDQEMRVADQNRLDYAAECIGRDLQVLLNSYAEDHLEEMIKQLEEIAITMKARGHGSST